VEQVSNDGDRRNVGWCVYCGGNMETRDHVPSKVLLDEPYPANLPVVPACRACNESFSRDEEYLACLLECVLAGAIRVEAFQRSKIRKILTQKPALAAALEAGRHHDGGGTMFTIDTDRMRNVVLKLARGHVAFEMNEPQLDEPERLAFVPLISMTDEAREVFEMHPSRALLPEVGSRMLRRRFFGSGDLRRDGWIIAQDGRYRYLVAAAHGYLVRIVLSEYLACEVVWT
jgi:hypothetical protein